MSHLGIKKITWDPEIPDEVVAAKGNFHLFLEEGYSAFNLSNSGGEGNKIQIFDALAEKILMIPRLGGG